MIKLVFAVLLVANGLFFYFSGLMGEVITYFTQPVQVKGAKAQEHRVIYGVPRIILLSESVSQSDLPEVSDK